MAARSEEQLLTELLRDLRASDNGVDAAGLEERVLAAWDRGRPPVRTTRRQWTRGRMPDTLHWQGIGGIAALALIVAAVTLSQRNPPDTMPALRPTVRPSVATTSVKPPDARPSPVRSPAAARPIARSSIAPSRVEASPVEFVPLMPMTERELAGSFQIVRVQMPRASLGALASPLEYPGELVEADVLLGEDGLARAIRLSTEEPAFPGRLR